MIFQIWSHVYAHAKINGEKMHKLKYLWFLFFAFFMSCSSVHHKKNNLQDNSDFSGISEDTIERSRGSGAIKLLPHQLRPIDYLLKNPDQKGLLVNHYMGTGKTFLGIGFAQAFKDHPVIILAPKFLEDNWRTSIAQYGVHDAHRFSFVSYDEAQTKLADKDLRDHIILADEVHNLIKLLRSANQQQNHVYTKVYMNLRNAHRILGLTGTPVYADESDLAFMINLVSGKTLMPFNQEAFRLEYTSIMTTRQFFRGYVLESNMFTYVFPPFLTLALGALFPPWGFAIGLPIGVLLPVGIRYLTPVETFKLRKINTDNMKDYLEKYVSYFRFDESKFKDFPAQKIETKNVPYNREQYSFFIKLVEGDLPVKHLQRLLKNDKIQMSDDFVDLNSSSIHDDIYRSVGAGRDIGNFEFETESGSIIEPPKFLQVLKTLKQKNEQTVVYSNYDKTGIRAFADFLKRQNYDQKYALIDPAMNADEVGAIVNDYNKGRIRVLLLHPDVTEGISLIGTQYLHILEPIINNTVLEQVIGRTRRFQSHTHLPKEKQLVNVNIWQSTSSGLNSDVSDIYRANWYKRYREISYMSLWGIGLKQVDKKLDQKILNPEELALIKLDTLKRNLSEMQATLTRVSIERSYLR